MAIATLLTVRATAGLPFTYYLKYDTNRLTLDTVDGLPQKLSYSENDGRIEISGVPVILGEFPITVRFTDGTEYSFKIMVTR